MPTNRKRLARKPVIYGLYDSMRFFLETGDWKEALDLYPECPGSIDTFRLALNRPRLREELKKIWLQHRDIIMTDWKKAKKPGLPWAEENL